MAIKDVSKNNYIIDKDSNIKVGIDLPIRFTDEKQSGFATTSTTIEAVKNNIRNLLNTNRGERLMQPQFGTDLRRVLFEPIDEGLIAVIQDTILDAFQIWLPFVQVNDINIVNKDSDTDGNKVIINIIFNIIQNPNTLDSVTLSFSSDIENSQETIIDSAGAGGTY